MEDIIFSDSNGNKLLGTLSVPEKVNSVVIISHGFSSSKESKLYVELQNDLNKAGIGTFRYDYYGHGALYCKESKYSVTKDITLSKAVDSLRAAIKLIRSKGDHSISLLGSSFGGLISLIIASQDSSIKALILRSSVTELIGFWKERLSDERINKWKEEGIIHYNEHGENYELNYGFWEDVTTYNTLEMAKSIICPTLIVHGDDDSTVPIEQSYNLSKIINTDVEVIKGANHAYSDSKQYSKMKHLIVDFFVEKLN